ncbi:MAG: S8 family serine peptidase [bacterium]|nr:S8 family serine peptidase [bacterium]
MMAPVQLIRISLVLLALLAVAGLTNRAEAAICGDVNASNQIDIADAVYLINFIFAGGPMPIDDALGDFNCSSQTDISDAVFMVNYIFASGPAPCSGSNCEPRGVMLTGVPSSPAIDAVYDFPHIPAKEDEIDIDGFMRTRLDCVLNPSATIQQVNAALTEIDALIVGMDSSNIFMTLEIPEVQTKAEADSAGVTLLESGAFLFAFGTFSAVASYPEPQPGRDLPPAGSGNIGSIGMMKAPALWNLRALAENQAAPVTALVPDLYFTNVPHSDISAQSFLTGGGTLTTTADANGAFAGNHGFHVCGILAADYDANGATGVHPGSNLLLDVQSLIVGGLSWQGIISTIAQHLPNERFLLNTSLGYNAQISSLSKVQRAVYALHWRMLAAPRREDFLHLSAAGNIRQLTDESRFAKYSSPWNTAKVFDTPAAMVFPDTVGFLGSLKLIIAWDWVRSQVPAAEFPLTNVIIVGSSQADYTSSAFSSFVPDLRTMGEFVCGPCIQPETSLNPASCQPNSGDLLAFYQGTSMATPQVTGLAAFIWNIRPDLSVNALRDLLQDTWTIGGTGILDGYLCALSLDDDLFTAPVRRTLLDVANAFGDSIPDGSFDEHDLARFRERLEFFEQLRIGIPSPAQDYSRFDLNGDGFTGGDYATRFDLDVDSPPSYGPITQTLQNGTQHFEENTVTDRDILCYYANSPLYQGQDLDVRDSLMIELGCPVCTGAKNSPNDCVDVWTLEVDFPGAVYDDAPLAVRVGRVGDFGTIWEPNVTVEYNVSGGSVLPLSTTTDASGLATTTATIDALAAAIDIEIVASVSGTVVATGSAHAVKAAVVQVYERQTSLDVYGPPSDYFGSYSDSRTNSQQLNNPEAGVSGAATSFVSHNSSLVVHEDLNVYVFTVGGGGTGDAYVSLSGEGCAEGASGQNASAGIVGGTAWFFEIFGSQEVKFTLELQTSFSNSNSFGAFGDGIAEAALRNLPGGFIVNLTTGPSHPERDTVITGLLGPGKYYFLGLCTQYASAGASPPSNCSSSASSSTSLNAVLTLEVPALPIVRKSFSGQSRKE